jgi:hypothetical protein
MEKRISSVKQITFAENLGMNILTGESGFRLSGEKGKHVSTKFPMDRKGFADPKIPEWQ